MWSNAGQRSDEGGWYKNAAAGAAFSLVNSSSATSASNATTTISYGTLAYSGTATRVIVAIAYSTGVVSQTVTAVSVNGVSFTQVSGCYVQQGTSFGTAVDIWIGTPGGSSGAVSVTYSAVTSQGSSVALYSLTTTTPAVAGQTNASSGFASSLGNTLNIPSGGGAIAIVETQNGSVLNSITNGAIDATPNALTNFGHSTVTGAGSVLTANLAASDVVAMCSASWGP